MTTNSARLPSELQTKYKDSKGIPVYIGDLLKVPHFITSRRRKVFMYKKVIMLNDRVYAFSVKHLGFLPIQECYKCTIDDCGNFEVIDGESVRHPLDGTLICWWERKNVAEPN